MNNRISEQRCAPASAIPALLALMAMLAACSDRSAPAAVDAPAVAPATEASAPATPEAATAENAEAEARVAQTIDALLGDSAAYRDAFDKLQGALKAGGKATFAALVSYPIEVRSGGVARTIENAQQFIASWDDILTPDIVQAITTQRFGDLFVNATGVMFGDGQVWLSGICRDASCASSDVRVTAIQSIGNQPSTNQTAQPPVAGTAACPGVDTQLSPSIVAEYATLVAHAMEDRVEPSAVRVLRHMSNGSWSAVWADTPVADQGVLFFEQTAAGRQFRDVWAGMAGPGDRQELIQWATRLGAPPPLAQCFADTVTG